MWLPPHPPVDRLYLCPALALPANHTIRPQSLETFPPLYPSLLPPVACVLSWPLSMGVHMGVNRWVNRWIIGGLIGVL